MKTSEPFAIAQWKTAKILANTLHSFWLVEISAFIALCICAGHGMLSVGGAKFIYTHSPRTTWHDTNSHWQQLTAWSATTRRTRRPPCMQRFSFGRNAQKCCFRILYSVLMAQQRESNACSVHVQSLVTLKHTEKYLARVLRTGRPCMNVYRWSTRKVTVINQFETTSHRTKIHRTHLLVIFTKTPWLFDVDKNDEQNRDCIISVVFFLDNSLSGFH